MCLILNWEVSCSWCCKCHTNVLDMCLCSYSLVIDAHHLEATCSTASCKLKHVKYKLFQLLWQLSTAGQETKILTLYSLFRTTVFFFCTWEQRDRNFLHPGHYYITHNLFRALITSWQHYLCMYVCTGMSLSVITVVRDGWKVEK